jgi:hypothetical protein
MATSASHKRLWRRRTRLAKRWRLTHTDVSTYTGPRARSRHETPWWVFFILFIVVLDQRARCRLHWHWLATPNTSTSNKLHVHPQRQKVGKHGVALRAIIKLYGHGRRLAASTTRRGEFTDMHNSHLLKSARAWV